MFVTESVGPSSLNYFKVSLFSASFQAQQGHYKDSLNIYFYLFFKLYFFTLHFDLYIRQMKIWKMLKLSVFFGWTKSSKIKDDAASLSSTTFGKENQIPIFHRKVIRLLIPSRLDYSNKSGAVFLVFEKWNFCIHPVWFQITLVA